MYRILKHPDGEGVIFLSKDNTILDVKFFNDDKEEFNEELKEQLVGNYFSYIHPATTKIYNFDNLEEAQEKFSKLNLEALEEK